MREGRSFAAAPCGTNLLRVGTCYAGVRRPDLRSLQARNPQNINQRLWQNNLFVLHSTSLLSLKFEQDMGAFQHFKGLSLFPLLSHQPHNICVLLRVLRTQNCNHAV